MSESQSLAEDYISYFQHDGSVSGADFTVYDDHIRIIQETDESEEDGEEGDTYYITRTDVDVDTWNELVALIEE